MAEVVLKDVSKVYEGKNIAVKNVNLTVKDKEFLVLVGPSGCGKTTTLRMVAGLEEISSGEIYVDGKLINELSPKSRDIAMVFQNYALYPHMTVYDNMAFGLKLRKYSKEEINKRVTNAAKILDLESCLKRKPKALSGGQRQRVAVGRAIVRHPKVFLFDEPLSNLDAKLRVQMRTELSKLHNRLEATILYVTHDQTEAMTMGDRIVVMKDGSVNQIDTPLNIYNFPVNLFVAGFIGSPPMNFINGKIIETENLKFVNDDKSFSVDLDSNRYTGIKNHIGKPVVLGIRPENIYNNPDDNLILKKHRIKLEVAEPMGNETILYFRFGNSQFIARVHAIEKPRPGEEVDIYFNLNKLHFFSLDDGKAIR
ncbi:MAG TPA: sn-glycerol-3-phosphate ABC transporter ATP-binding protein UgpC [Ignavibacteria bacterium]|nr:sn-glycerol-3-phosphate ABC transporter ATP-binding protein UgpC [Ignavibacteria bacterium]